MQSHGPKRVYTPQSLEFWFDRLEHEWETAFTAEQLEHGRRIYRDGEVRELELTAKDAIIHRRVEKKDEYAVIEWGPEGIAVRSSSTDKDLAHALAVAGLHEIEELVADEISPLPGDPPRVPRNGNGASNGHLAAPRKIGSGEGMAAAAASAQGPSRTLLLVFKTKTAGLTFQAFWAEADGKTRHAALGTAAHANGNGHVTSTERTKLIGLAAYARKAHFIYHQDTGVYLMESLVEIPNFLKTVLPAWRRMFAVELDDKSANLLKGTRAVEIEAVAERIGGGGASGDAGANGDVTGLNLRWIFRAGERMLTDAEVNTLLKKKGGPVILPSLGIVSISGERWESFSAWRDNFEETHAAGALSPYLVFSLFNDARLKLTLSPEIELWRQRVLAQPEAPPPLPEILRPYQRRGVEWLAHLCDVGCHGLLADEMGLGKTLQVITLLATRPVDGKPCLVVCPASVVPVWREEIAKFQPG